MILSSVRKSGTGVTDPAQEFYQVVFNADTSTLNVLKEMNEETDPVRVIVIDQAKTLTFSIQASDLVFNENPIEWVLGSFPHELSLDRKTLTLQAEPLPSEIQPLVLNLVANLTNPQASGIRTPTIYLSATASVSSNLQGQLRYELGSGSFKFNSEDPLETGQWIVFLNHQGEEDITVDISLVSNSTGASISFSNPPIVWLRPEGVPPSWIHVNRQSGQSIQIINQFSEGIGLAAPFRFVLDVNGVLIESPDPILVNTTIGDG